jgi:hypothetical protein
MVIHMMELVVVEQLQLEDKLIQEMLEMEVQEHQMQF